MLGNRRFKIGHLDRRLKFYKYSETNDSITNQAVESWEYQFVRQGKRIQKSAKSIQEARQERELKTFEYIIRYDPEAKLMDATWRLIDDEETLYISGTEKNRREGYIIIYCEYKE